MPKGKAKVVKELKCEFCQEMYGFSKLRTIKSLNQHIRRDPFHPTIEAYVKRYGEFRTQSAPTYDTLSSNFHCLQCNKGFHSHKRLAYHVRIDHGMDFIEDYVKKLVFKKEIQSCKCGCGEEIKLLAQPPYKREYIPGHNGDHTGMTRSFEARMNMRKAAIKRMEEGNHPFYLNSYSKTEKEVVSWIKSIYKGRIIENDKKVLSGLELDIYLPEINLAIEFNGEHFHDTIRSKDKYRLKKKTEECNNKGIHLIHVWYGPWYRKENIYKSILANQLGVTQNKIYGRNTSVVELNSEQARKFLEANHLQGSCISKVRLGLQTQEGELVSVMTFISSNRGITKAKKVKNGYELLRFCNKTHTQVVGGASKLFKYFKVKYSPHYIKSYADRDWARGSMYEHLGFKFTHFSAPDYFYHKSKIHYGRVSFQKHKLVQQGFDPNKTEFEIMSERGYNRVYGTGNFVFEWTN